jgi:hypothetical protein
MPRGNRCIHSDFLTAAPFGCHDETGVQRRIQDEPFVHYKWEFPSPRELGGAFELLADGLFYPWFVFRKMVYTPSIKLLVVEIGV